MSSSINKNVNVERRTWDKETYEARAKSRAAAEAAERDDNQSSQGARMHKIGDQLIHAVDHCGSQLKVSSFGAVREAAARQFVH